VEVHQKAVGEELRLFLEVEEVVVVLLFHLVEGVVEGVQDLFQVMEVVIQEEVGEVGGHLMVVEVVEVEVHLFLVVEVVAAVAAVVEEEH